MEISFHGIIHKLLAMACELRIFFSFCKSQGFLVMILVGAQSCIHGINFLIYSISFHPNQGIGRNPVQHERVIAGFIQFITKIIQSDENIFKGWIFNITDLFGDFTRLFHGHFSVFHNIISCYCSIVDGYVKTCQKWIFRCFFSLGFFATCHEKNQGNQVFDFHNF